MIKVRIYPVRYKRVRAIVHDGFRWRRLEEWDLEGSRTVVRWHEYGHTNKVLASPMTTTLTAPGFDHVHVDELVHVN